MEAATQPNEWLLIKLFLAQKYISIYKIFPNHMIEWR